MSTIEKIELFSPCYTGSRFDAHRFPVDLLEDLLVLKKMTVEMAKEIYLKKNPERKRVPKNFANGISIELEGIESGSTIPKLVLIASLTSLFLDTNHECFAKAPKHITQVIEAAYTNGDLNGLVPDSVLNYFNQFGNNLLDDEQIVFGNKESSKAIFNKESRKKLLLAASKSKQYTEQSELRGKVIALDKDRKTFEIQLITGQKIKGEYSASELDLLQDAFVNLEKNQKIWMKVRAVFNIYDKLQAIEAIEELSLLDTLDVQARLEELAMLPYGWLDGKQGVPLDAHACKWLGETFDNCFSSILPLPATFPTPDGNVQFEWSIKTSEISLEVDLATKKASYYAVDSTNNKEETEELDLNINEDWNKLNKKMKVLNG